MIAAALTAAEVERLTTARDFASMSDTALDAAVRAAVITHGGTLTLPCSQWGPLETELTLMGISGTGDGTSGAARSWIKHCLRSANAARNGEAA